MIRIEFRIAGIMDRDQDDPATKRRFVEVVQHWATGENPENDYRQIVETIRDRIDNIYDRSSSAEVFISSQTDRKYRHQDAVQTRMFSDLVDNETWGVTNWLLAHRPIPIPEEIPWTVSQAIEQSSSRAFVLPLTFYHDKK